MSPSSSLIVILASVCFSAAAPQWTSSDVPIANTTSGRLLPLLDTTFPNVYQYLGVPFAQPPINHLRFAPPQPVVSAPGLLNATLLPSACYQLTPLQNIYDEYEPGFGVFGPQSEDCLKLNVFRPSLQAQQPLPIIIYVYGGAFVEGASNQTYEIPTPWVQEKQDLIVVTIQYRVNIFGFPNSAGLTEQNLGLQDIRAAVEWVQTNAAAFGGDPQRLTLWGQSAGSIAVNAWTYSYLDDPIVTGTISTSGTALTPGEGWKTADSQQTNFTFVAENLGCSGNSSAQLSCVRTKPAAAISQIVNQYRTNVTFKPVPDEELVFSNYTERLYEGKIAQQPAILGSNRREGERSIDKGFDINGPNQTLALAYTAAAFLCPAELTTKLRHQSGVPTYRYEYKGNFSNISPLPWMGAYHGSPLPLLFGTTNMQSAHPLSGASTPFELAVGSHMQDYWRSFAANPHQLTDWPLNDGGQVNQTTDAVKLFPGTDHQLSSITYGAKREEFCAEIDPYLISMTLPPQLTAELSAGSLGNA